MIKLIPSPKTYEISDEVLRFPLKLCHGEPGRPLGTHLECPPQRHRRRIHRNVPGPTPPPRPPHPGQMNMPEGRCTHRPSVRFDTMPILSSQKARCFVVGYKYPPAVEKCLLFWGGSAIIWTIQYFLVDACRRMRHAAEGVTLSGVRKDEDCKRTELWRNPLSWGPKVQSAYALISQAKGQSVSSFLGGIFLLWETVPPHGLFYFRRIYHGIHHADQ